MGIPVEPAFLYSIRNQAAFTWRKMLCELIDNSLDANASEVSIGFPGGKVFKIEDNGSGTDDLMRLVTLGRRQEHASNDVGKYGVGCKLALIWLWGVSSLRSTTIHGTQSLEINWGRIAEGLDEYPSEPNRSEPTGKTGTKIVCMGDRSYTTHDALIKSLGSTYTPGLEAGKRICVSRNGPSKVLEKRQWPKTDEEIDCVIEAAGRPVRIKMGLISQGVVNPYAEGFSFERTYRVIKESTLGANGFSVSRIAARITLGNEWELSTNKDDFCEFQDELADAIYERCHVLMAKASDQAVSIEDNEFNKELAAIIQESERVRRRESRPNTTGQSGTVEPKSTGRRRENATESTDNPGSVVGYGRKGKRRGFTVETYQDPEGCLLFGKYDADGNRVRLNVSNPWLAEMHKGRNRDALLPVVYGILADASYRQQVERTPLFSNQFDDFVTQWGSAVAAAALAEVTL
jgi:hypothetical protein